MIVAVFTLSSVQMINSIKSVIHDSCTGHPISHKRIEKMRDHPESGFFFIVLFGSWCCIVYDYVEHLLTISNLTVRNYSEVLEYSEYNIKSSRTEYRLLVFTYGILVVCHARESTGTCETRLGNKIFSSSSFFVEIAVRNLTFHNKGVLLIFTYQYQPTRST